jgi:hypothetical protein
VRLSLPRPCCTAVHVQVSNVSSRLVRPVSQDIVCDQSSARIAPFRALLASCCLASCIIFRGELIDEFSTTWNEEREDTNTDREIEEDKRVVQSFAGRGPESSLLSIILCGTTDRKLCKRSTFVYGRRAVQRSL